MNTEQQHIHKVKVDFAYLDAQGYIKPHGYQHIIGKVIDEHLSLYKLDFSSCLEKNLGWVLVSLHVDIKKHIQGCANLHIRTWHSERKRLYFRRELEAFDASGAMVFVATIYSVLMDFSTQSIYRKSELPFTLESPHAEFTLDVAPVFKEKPIFEKVGERTVLRSFIDAFGHVNNCRYGEFIFDALSDEHADMYKIQAFSIYFCSELKLHDIFHMEENINDKITLHGHNVSAQKTAFFAEIFMKKPNVASIHPLHLKKT